MIFAALARTLRRRTQSELVERHIRFGDHLAAEREEARARPPHPTGLRPALERELHQRHLDHRDERWRRERSRCAHELRTLRTDPHGLRPADATWTPSRRAVLRRAA